MQLKYNRQPSLGSSIFKILIKLLLLIVFLLFSIFLIEKISFPSPEKNIKLTLPMKLKSFNYNLGLLIIIFFFSHALSEEKIDIWKNNNDIATQKETQENLNNKEEFNLNKSQPIKALDTVQIQEGSTIQSDEQKVYGIYDPAQFDFDLNMWSATKAEDLRSSINRLKLNFQILQKKYLRVFCFPFHTHQEV